MQAKVLIPCLAMAAVLLVGTSVGDMSAGTKNKINNGLVSGQKVVDFLAKLGDPKTQKVFDTLGKMASFLGAAGGIISFALLFVPQQDSAELKYMKEKFAEVNMKLDVITTELDSVKDLITYENQRAVYLTSASKILFGHKKLQEFLNEIQSTTCSGKRNCDRVRARIASRYVDDFNIKQHIFKILRGATQRTSAFGDPLLGLVKKTFKCHVVKIDRFANSILKLSFKAQQVIMAHEKLTGSKHSITQSMDTWLKSVYDLRDATTATKKTCFDDIKNQMVKDINNKKYQVGVSSNDAANAAVKGFMDEKYPWLGWVVYSYGAYGGSKHCVTNVNGAFWNMPKDQNERKRNIIVNFIDKSGRYGNQKYTVLKAIDDMLSNTNFYSVRNDACKLMPKVEEGLKKENAWKYVNSLNILRDYDGLVIKADNDLSYISEEYTFTSHYMYKGQRRYLYDKVRLIISLKSEEKAAGSGCQLDCKNQGACSKLPYSSVKYCKCKPYYQGDQCQDHAKAQLAKTMDAMLEKTLKLPMLSDISYDIKDLREYVGVSFGALQAAVSELEKTLQKAFDNLSRQMTSRFQWANLITHYSNAIRMVKFYAYRFEDLPTRYANRIDQEGKKLATAVLATDGIEKWLYEINFLFLGRSGTPLLNHEPLMVLFMSKYKAMACSAVYKAAVDNSWRQLVLLQQIGFMLWAQALEFEGRSSENVRTLYDSRTTAQASKLKAMSCEYSIANSPNIQCSGGSYVHPGITLTTRCNADYYVTGSMQSTCVSKNSGCSPCNCNAAGSNGAECDDITGKCTCKNGFYGDKCQNRDCVWRQWSGYSSCSKSCDYGGSQSKTRSHRVTKQGQGAGCSGSSSASRSCFNRCCSNQYHCSNRRKCIPSSYRCDYDNDCGDNQDENSCSEQCDTKYTSWNSHGGGESVYFDRHRLNCGGKGDVLKMFHLERSGGSIRFKYICCKLNKPTICSLTKKETGFTYDGDGDTVYLDRQTVSCGSHGYLNDYWLSRNDNHDKIRYEYYCCNLKEAKHRSRTHCYTSYTSFTYDGDGKSYYLDRQTVQCASRYYLTYFKLQRNSGKDRWRYKYTCCKINS